MVKHFPANISTKLIDLSRETIKKTKFNYKIDRRRFSSYKFDFP